MPGQDVSGDTSKKSEGIALEDGYITISTIDATENAPRAKALQVRRLLKDLVYENYPRHSSYYKK